MCAFVVLIHMVSDAPENMIAKRWDAKIFDACVMFSTLMFVNMSLCEPFEILLQMKASKGDKTSRCVSGSNLILQCAISCGNMHFDYRLS